jgi:2-dehydropantoate 2-reductase
VGGALAKFGHPVTLLVRPDRRDHYPNQVTVESATLGTFEAPVRVTDRIDEPFDIVWITVKATALDAALEAVPEQDLGSGVVVPLLNGIEHVAQLRERYGPERVLSGTIRVEAERLEPGRVRQLSPFANLEVAPSPALSPRAEELCGELRAAGLSCEVQDDEVTMLWGKLCFLAPFALATTASGDTLGAVRSDASWRSRLEACVTDACSVAIAEGANLTSQPILAALEGAPDALRSSMQKDVYVGCGFCKDVPVCVGIYQKGALWISTNGFSRSELKKSSVGVNPCPGCEAWARRSWLGDWRALRTSQDTAPTW